MNVSLDHENCISCGLCVTTCPEVFRFAEDGKAITDGDTVPSGCKDAVDQAAIACPVSVIKTSK